MIELIRNSLEQNFRTQVLQKKLQIKTTKIDNRSVCDMADSTRLIMETLFG
ncbi:hypothetical protein KIN20_000100 [Parelaphostrongylus tenuis]|uniref:Uncharacterized protein n=1 Tax=Parelaphostrongylus tenuis TaxID=148309 RepID=A0AAD5MD61_PARTN|nr:hypothetical protein KIN20_000100 [Parelaphostrongylus tenuis]